MEPWFLKLVVCQSCGGRLCGNSLSGEDSFLLSCADCDTHYPVLAGVPILMRDPEAYVSRHRDSLLAILAEWGKASKAAVNLVCAFGGQKGESSQPLARDWTLGEAALGGCEKKSLDDAGPAYQSFLKIRQEAEDNGLLTKLLKIRGRERAGLSVELGPGAGHLSMELAARSDRLLLIDSSPASLFLAGERAREQNSSVGLLVADAADLDLAVEDADWVVAANLIDLLDEPEAFVRNVGRWLSKDGSLLLSTPDPELGGDDSKAVVKLLKECEFDCLEVCDAIPWLREHDSRYCQLYWAMIVHAKLEV